MPIFTCPECEGTGRVHVCGTPETLCGHDVQTPNATCAECDGTGEIEHDEDCPCESCMDVRIASVEAAYEVDS